MNNDTRRLLQTTENVGKDAKEFSRGKRVMFEKIYRYNIFVKFPHHDRSVNYKLMQQTTTKKGLLQVSLLDFIGCVIIFAGDVPMGRRSEKGALYILAQFFSCIF